MAIAKNCTPCPAPARPPRSHLSTEEEKPLAGGRRSVGSCTAMLCRERPG